MKHLKGNKNTFQKRMYCKKTEIDLSKSGTGLFPGAFYMNQHVKRVILPDYADTVPANLFKGCINLKEVTLPIDPDIGEAAFEGCISLTDIHIPLCIGSVATNAFRGMSGKYQIPCRLTEYQPENIEATYREGAGTRYRTV